MAGDLLNQITTSAFCARGIAVPFLGLYGACSTLAEGLTLSAILVDGGYACYVMVATSSHNSSAERQYRYPTAYGAQRPLYAQRTVTGAGAVIVGKKGEGPYISSATIGKVHDLGIKDAVMLGSAMAPAAAGTIGQHMRDLQLQPDSYDLILTGDLGAVGKSLAVDLLERQGFNLPGNYTDCGVLIYYPHQKADSGGSGCACIAVVCLGHFYNRMLKGDLGDLLLVATGALHSPTSHLQQETIPAIAHGISLKI